MALFRRLRSSRLRSTRSSSAEFIRHCDGVDAYLFVNVPAVAVAVVAVAVVVAAAAKGALARALVAAVAAADSSVLSPGSCRGASSTPRLVNFSP